MDIREEYFIECEFKSDGGDCDQCSEEKKGARLWFNPNKRKSYLPASYEYPDEGYYYCDTCALKEIEEINEQEK